MTNDLVSSALTRELQVLRGRAEDSTLGQVADDWQAIAIWFTHLTVKNPPASDATLNTYHREIRRLKWYCETQGFPNPSLWSLQDVHAYAKFLKQKSLAYKKINVYAKHGDPDWTPFRGQLSDSSVADALKVMNSLFRFWVANGYVSRNPFAGLGSSRNLSERRPRRLRSLSANLVAEVLDIMDRRPKKTTVDRLLHVRNRFVLILLERTGLRANELAMADMKDIQLDAHKRTGELFWFIRVTHGKGGISDQGVPLDQQTMDAFRAYRFAFGLSENPHSKETKALVLSPHTTNPLRSDGTVMHYRPKTRRNMGAWGEIRRRQTIWDIVKGVFKAAAEVLKAEGQADAASRLSEASTHWLRHTYGTGLVLGGHDLRLVALAMRHKDINTTMGYTELDVLDVAKALQERDKSR